MRILLITHYFWPENYRINDLVLGLRDRGHDIEVLTGIPNYPSGTFYESYGLLKRRKDRFGGVPIYRTPGVPRGKGGHLRLLLNFLSFPASAGLLGPIYCRSSYDLIFVYEPSPITTVAPALIMKAIKGSPVVLWIQDLWPESLSATGAITSPPLLKLVELGVRLLYKGCDRILVQSRSFFSAVRRLGVDPKLISYYPNSAENLYQPVEVGKDAPERDLFPAGFCITFAGNIGAAQDFETILVAAEKLKNSKDIHFIILGDGRMRPWVEKEVEKRGLQRSVHLLGRFPAESMPRFFALSDALLVTLKNDPVFALTIPSKVQSYLACGRPVIAALEGEGARIIEESGAGIACPAEDPHCLSEAVLRLYNMSSKKRKKMGEKGRDYFEHNFERELLLDRLEGWMYRLAGGTPVKSES
ncbi:MAG: glycosyltransferase family 4 protein [Desulfobacterales bacterium]|nr:glycosyltransferase family 4 protein [Desulfobacterales bacterium]